MGSKRDIFIILVIVLLLGVLVQSARADYVNKLTNNKGWEDGKALEPMNAISGEQPDRPGSEKLLLIYDSEETESLRIRDNIGKTMEYMKKECSSVDQKDFTGLKEKYGMVIVAMESLKKLAGLDGLMDYVESGGRLLMAECLNTDNGFYRIYRKLGINEAGGIIHARGIRFLSNVMIGSDGLAIDGDPVENYAKPVRLSKQCRIHITSADGIPLMWETDYGKGRLMVFNGTMLQDKVNRGLITGVVSLLMEDFLYPVPNIKIVFIDDFPAPMSQGTNRWISEEYNRNIVDFYRDVWWPDMLKTAGQCGLKYTGLMIRAYNNCVRPPFPEADGLNKTDFIMYAGELIKNGGELGMHGYNHQPLVDTRLAGELAQYSPWENREAMSAGLSNAASFVRSIFPNYKLQCYVPPSNVLGDKGRSALINALPDLKVIASVYCGDKGSDAYIQEFEQAGDGIVELPRLTSGYENSYATTWSLINGITSLGIFSHFVHPDDVLDDRRNHGKRWEELSYEFNDLQREVRKKYGWLRSMTASQGAKELEKYLRCKVVVERSEDGINGYCNDFVPDMYFILRTNKSISSAAGCSVKLVDDGVYLVCAGKAAFTIGLGQVDP